jgi:hypothetical protein
MGVPGTKLDMRKFLPILPILLTLAAGGCAPAHSPPSGELWHGESSGVVYTATLLEGGESALKPAPGNALEGGESASGYLSAATGLDGSVYAVTYELGRLVLLRLEPSSSEIVSRVAISSELTDVALFDGDERYTIYMKRGTAFYGVDLAASTAIPLFDFLECGLNPAYVVNIRRDGDGYLCLMEDPRTHQFEVYRIAPIDPAATSGKQVLTLALFMNSYATQNLRDWILEFNRTNAEYEIKIVTYESPAHGFYSYNDPAAKGNRRFMLDVTTGNVPDIIDVSVLPIELYARKGLFEDLYPYMDRDPELSREDFYPNVLRASEVENALIFTSSQFQIMTALGSAKLLGDIDGIDIEGALDIVKNNDITYLFGDEQRGRLSPNQAARFVVKA